MKNFWYLFAAYTAVWTGLFIYTMRLSRKNRELAEELRLLQHQVTKALTK
ncbi:MAG: CcmD family protein [Candidatus Tectimicrobiota bacterium]